MQLFAGWPCVLESEPIADLRNPPRVECEETAKKWKEKTKIFECNCRYWCCYFGGFEQALAYERGG